MKKTFKANAARRLPKEVKALIREEKNAYILDLMIKGWTSPEIQKDAAVKFNETERSIRNSIQKLNAALVKEGNVDKDRQRTLRIKQLEAIYKQQLADGDSKDAVNTLNMIIKLEGTEAPKQAQIVTHNVNHNSNSPEQFNHLSIEDKRKILLMLNPSASQEGESDAEIVE